MKSIKSKWSTSNQEIYQKREIEFPKKCDSDETIQNQPWLKNKKFFCAEICFSIKIAIFENGAILLAVGFSHFLSSPKLKILINTMDTTLNDQQRGDFEKKIPESNPQPKFTQVLPPQNPANFRFNLTPSNREKLSFYKCLHN